MTLALDERLNKGRGPEWDSNTDEAVRREPVVSDKVLQIFPLRVSIEDPLSGHLGVGDVHLAKHLCLLDVEFQSSVVPESLPQLGEDFQGSAEAPHEVAVVGIRHRSLAEVLNHDAPPDMERRLAEGNHLRRITLGATCLTENVTHTIVPAKVPVSTGIHAHGVEVAKKPLHMRRRCLEGCRC